MSTRFRTPLLVSVVALLLCSLAPAALADGDPNGGAGQDPPGEAGLQGPVSAEVETAGTTSTGAALVGAAAKVYVAVVQVFLG